MAEEKLKTKDRVLLDLLDHVGSHVSGDQLAQDLDISRESVWKAVKSLQKDGHTIVSKKKTGYAYLYSDHVDEMVTSHYLKSLSEGKQAFDKIQITEGRTSTQTDAKEFLAMHPGVNPTLFAARSLAGAYGRRGRAFFAPRDHGLYFSLSLPITNKEEVVASLLTTSAADVIANVLEESFPGVTVDLKWVNDLIVDRHKVGGLITEAVFDMETQQYTALVLGIGLNVLPSDFPEDITQKAGTVLSEKTDGVDLNFLLARLILALVQMGEDYADGRYLDDYRKRSLLIDKTVSVQVGQDVVAGEVQGVSKQGGLEVKTADGDVQTLYAGEVTKVKLLENLNL
ncbi:biotin--[acetyl-CoA-carboxylase] ligase [Fructobacillus sp. M2-14]|uniref:biotin--[biotin carboxyl-carrier protein] ligase n=1 Tax=Fructobacillus broussonetiae TaxID=2713173 RepID=A0ABS5QYQ8_9LACO|nr:biotin--[acetyl-CoA-carboxylase] ligase [Fructobacillus broussonetiae]MBS9338280.1 biotin--[acetyl-CoA-carboxylase] ligase [Fructobacillus broussonetiae]